VSATAVKVNATKIAKRVAATSSPHCNQARTQIQGNDIKMLAKSPSKVRFNPSGH
jgi:hypothetical protein